MSTVSRFRQPKAPRPEPDPYRYGWRYVLNVAADGTETFDQVPLTLKDVLFPEEGDFIVETDWHDTDRIYLKTVFKSQLTTDSTAVVLGDCRVDWNLRGVRPLGPDVSVFWGVKRRRDWATFNMAAEGAVPALVVEITSPDTRKNDVGPKFKYYHRAKVPVYLIADVSERRGKRHVELIGYEYAPGGYKRITPDARGRIYLDAVRLWIGVMPDGPDGLERLVCYDALTGKELGDYTTMRVERDQAIAETTEAKRQARVARRQARAESRRAEAESRRAEAEAIRAAAEGRARAEAEARVRELEAELKLARGEQR